MSNGSPSDADPPPGAASVPPGRLRPFHLYTPRVPRHLEEHRPCTRPSACGARLDRDPRRGLLDHGRSGIRRPSRASRPFRGPGLGGPVGGRHLHRGRDADLHAGHVHGRHGQPGPPYFEAVDTPTDPWELGDPTTGNGFESAVGYAIADQLGFAKENVTWVPSPFDTVLAPGPKQFDAYIGQVSFAPERTETVDLSEGYYFNNQAIVARKDTPITEAKSIADLANWFGAQVGTTSLATIESVITPKTDPSVYNSMTRRSPRSMAARSMPSWSTFRPRSISVTPRWTEKARSSASSSGPPIRTRSTSASSCRRTAR